MSTITFPEGHVYRGMNPLFWIDIRNGSITHSDMNQIVWKQRAVEVIDSLKMFKGLPDATFPVLLHDGCGAFNRHKDLRYLSYGVKAACPTAIPLPVTPSCHNPLWPDFQLHNKRIETAIPWKHKSPVAVWRGGFTDRSGIRNRTVVMSTLVPNLIDAQKVTPNGQDNRMAFEDFFTHKFILDLDGAGGSFRTTSLLCGGSVVIKPDTYKYWWTDAFKGGYVTIRPDLSDLIEIIERLQKDDNLAYTIAKKATMAIRHGALGLSHQRSVWIETLKLFPSNATFNGQNGNECIKNGCYCLK